jgi:23S rRNA (uracil1939-C5)-methyltransferase
MTVTTEKITAGGECIARLDGKVVFIPDSLPNETLDIELASQKRDYARAKIIRVIEPSPHRIRPPCAFYGACGGCNLQIAGHEYQLELKKSIAEDTFRRAGCAAPPVTVISGSPWAYRSRIQLHARDNRAGFMARNSNEIIPVDNCPVLVPRLNESLRAMLTETGTRAKTRKIFGRGNLCAAYIQDGDRCKEVVAAENTAECFMPVLGERVYFNPRGFFQSNIPLFEKLIQSLCASLNDADGNSFALDLYGGCGVLAHFLQKKFDRVVLVEENGNTSESAWKNASGAEIYAMSAKRWLAGDAARREYGAVVVDPPRKGLEKEVLEWLCASIIRELRYISCDPVTLARDSARLAASGYTFRSLELYDFYPQTNHLEMFAVFSKKYFF